jgi:O-antigen/teichoic acid export membrane protein
VKAKLANPLVRNTLWSLGGLGTRLFIQAAYFIIIARCLGPGQYGAFIAATALIAVISPFVGLGSGILLIKNVARDRRLFSEYWGNGLVMTLLSGGAFTLLTLGLCRLVLPRSIPMLMIVFIGVSDLIFVKLLDMAAWAYQGMERLAGNAQLNVLVSLTRLIGIGWLALAFAHPSVMAWSAVYLAGSVVAAVIAIARVTFSLGKPTLALHRIRGESVEGFYFSVSQCALTIYNDIDKTMVARLSTLDAAGIYAAAYRLIDVSCIPTRALLNAAYPGFFRSGAQGLESSMNYCRRLLRRILPYPLVAFAALMLGAPIIPHILGHDYGRVTEALRWLALLPLLKTGHYFVADALTGAGYQGVRTSIQSGIAAFNILINLWIIPHHGWRGAAWSSLASDGLLLLSLWVATAYLRRSAAIECPPSIVEAAVAGQ